MFTRILAGNTEESQRRIFRTQLEGLQKAHEHGFTWRQRYPDARLVDMQMMQAIQQDYMLGAGSDRAFDYQLHSHLAVQGGELVMNTMFFFTVHRSIYREFLEDHGSSKTMHQRCPHKLEAPCFM